MNLKRTLSSSPDEWEYPRKIRAGLTWSTLLWVQVFRPPEDKGLKKPVQLAAFAIGERRTDNFPFLFLGERTVQELRLFTFGYVVVLQTDRLHLVCVYTQQDVFMDECAYDWTFHSSFVLLFRCLYRIGGNKVEAYHAKLFLPISLNLVRTVIGLYARLACACQANPHDIAVQVVGIYGVSYRRLL